MRNDGLEKAVREQAKALEPAQCEFVLAQFEHYRWNAERIAKLEAQLEGSQDDECRDLDHEGKLFRQRHQLVAEQSVLFKSIMQHLKGTGATESKLDAFLNG